MRILRARYQSGDDFLRHYQPSLTGGGLFFPTREAMTLGDPVVLEIRFPGLANKQMIRGFVAWRRAGKHRTKLRAGLGIEFHNAEARRRDFLIAVAKGEIVEMVTRRHRRLPVQLVANWRVVFDRETHHSHIEDIGPGGAFLRTTEFLPPGTEIVLDVTPPGSLRALEIAGRVAWTRHSDGEEGIGIEFKARDAGGTRRLKELVRRLELLEAESAMDGEDISEVC
ncbi:MAG: PilZ domain-containing protein [Polyangia bacterium]